MNTLILSLHITAALVTTVAIIAVTVSAYAGRETKSYITMLASFTATAVSGIGLLFVLAGGLGRFCVMMSAYAIFVAAAHLYYRRQITAKSSL